MQDAESSTEAEAEVSGAQEHAGDRRPGRVVGKLFADYWASHGGLAQQGYPISDELIPDPRVGHRRPEVIKKPIASLPAGLPLNDRM